MADVAAVTTPPGSLIPARLRTSLTEGRCMAPENPKPMVTTMFCVYPAGHDASHSWQDSPSYRRERMKREGWS